MGQDEGRNDRIAKLAKKIGSVAAAAAALLADGNARSSESDLHRDLLDRNRAVGAISRAMEGVADLPPPLVLKPADGELDLLLARGHSSHRSHSSHSSHRSHVSGASHASHYSSSPRVGSGVVSSPASNMPAATSTPYTSTPSRVSSADAEATQQRVPSSLIETPASASTPRNEKPMVRDPDFSNPLERFKLITISTRDGILKAFIKDEFFRSVKLLEVGETIGDCKLIKIAPIDKYVTLKPKKGAEVMIRQPPPSR
jgi:hypothetical protein